MLYVADFVELRPRHAYVGRNNDDDVPDECMSWHAAHTRRLIF